MIHKYGSVPIPADNKSEFSGVFLIMVKHVMRSFMPHLAHRCALQEVYAANIALTSLSLQKKLVGGVILLGNIS